MWREKPRIEVRSASAPPDGTFIVALMGDHDLATRPMLLDALGGLAPTATIVLDLSLCTFIDSTIVGAILALAPPNGLRVAVVLPPDTTYVVRALSVIGVRDVLPVHASVAAALECLGGPSAPQRDLGSGRELPGRSDESAM